MLGKGFKPRRVSSNATTNGPGASQIATSRKSETPATQVCLALGEVRTSSNHFDQCRHKHNISTRDIAMVDRPTSMTPTSALIETPGDVFFL